MIIQIIRLKSDLPEEELLTRAHERAPQFKILQGLVQKYYIKQAEPGHYAGIYVWESKEAMLEYKQSDLAAGIPKAYEIISPPEVEVVDVMFQLRD